MKGLVLLLGIILILVGLGISSKGIKEGYCLGSTSKADQTVPFTGGWAYANSQPVGQCVQQKYETVTANPSDPNTKMITFFPNSRGFGPITLPISGKQNCIDMLKVLNPTVELGFGFWKNKICDAVYGEDPEDNE